MQISRDEARMLSVIAQRLDRRPRTKPTKARVMEMIEHLGCVQIDTISVVARSHETVLWSRLGAFDPADIWTLYAERRLFEYWTHAAAITPIEFVPHVRNLMDRYRRESIGSWLEEHAETVEIVREALAAGDPVSSRTFERPMGPRAEPWAWYGSKPTKQALDYLWTVGDLTVVNRRGFERLYDLSDRAIPSALRAATPTEQEWQRFFVQRAMRAMGVATARWVADYFRAGSKSHVAIGTVPRVLGGLVEAGECLEVFIEGIEERAWMHLSMVERLEELRAGRRRPTLTTLLSPFDSLVWHRGRALSLFDFDYRLESYTPELKRVYGYYTLPVLHRGRLIGRIDLHYSRKARLLTMRAIHLESWVKPDPGIANAIIATVRDYTQFLGGGEIIVGACHIPGFSQLLHERIGSQI